MNKRAKIISAGIQKGGAGKTTTVGMLTFILAQKGFKCLAVDFDSQGNLTQFISQRDPYDFIHKTSLQACKDGDPRPYIVEIEENIHLLPAEDFLSKFTGYVLTEYVKEQRDKGITVGEYDLNRVLQKTLEVVRNDYDFIFIDLPPNLGEQTLNGMAASDYALVMMQTEPFCISSIERYLETLESVIDKVNPNTALLGILPTLMDARGSLPKHLLKTLRDNYGSIVFETVINKKARIMEYTYGGYQLRTKIDHEAQEMYFRVINEMFAMMGLEPLFDLPTIEKGA